MKYQFAMCMVCGSFDSQVVEHRYDMSGCGECYSIEQGFLYLADFDGFDDLLIDEDGFIYKQDHELEGPIACEWRG